MSNVYKKTTLSVETAYGIYKSGVRIVVLRKQPSDFSIFLL